MEHENNDEEQQERIQRLCDLEERLRNNLMESRRLLAELSGTVTEMKHQLPESSVSKKLLTSSASFQNAEYEQENDFEELDEEEILKPSQRRPRVTATVKEQVLLLLQKNPKRVFDISTVHGILTDYTRQQVTAALSDLTIGRKLSRVDVGRYQANLRVRKF